MSKPSGELIHRFLRQTDWEPKAYEADFKRIIDTVATEEREATVREVVAELRTGWIGEVWGSDALEIADGIESKFLPAPETKEDET